MIKIFMQEGKWRMGIEAEIWEFEELSDLVRILNEIIGHKNDFGKIK
jgi:hypothetical protein